MTRIAIIYDDQVRPETTGGYCRRALGGLAEVEHFLPAAADHIPPSGFDLYLRVDDGLDWVVPEDLRPCAWWAIDTHLDFGRCLEQARRTDLTFAAQRDGAEALRQAGITDATWLPLACDPDVHARHDLAKDFDVCFVGNLAPGPRTELLELLRGHFPNTFVGRRYFEEMAKTYSAARAVFNRSIRNDVNMRVFEALACGSLLVTNDLDANGQSELFRDGVHLATYREADELLDKVRFYLDHPEARARVEAAGRREAVSKHTYRLRMARLLAAAERLPRAVAVTRPPATRPAAAAEPHDQGPPVPPVDPGYFEHGRPELLARIPAQAGQVLDVGCGAGRLGEALKARQPVRVTGLERDAQAAAAARQRLDEVLVGDVETLAVPFAPAAFDCVVCGDVLEHLRDPLTFLRQVRGWLQPDGTLVVSLPNVRHHTVLRGLLDGHWTYEPAGLLDDTHLRFFTRREAEKLLFRAGFQLLALTPLPGPEHGAWVAQGRPGEVQIGGLRVGGLTPEAAEEFYTYQYLLEARPAPAADFGLTSVVVLTHNELAYTRQCVASLRLLTDEPYELIFVDNASTDGTRRYLEALGAADPRVRLIANDTNRGFPVAANQGIRVARGRQVLLLNNDTVLTTGWLRRLLQALHADPTVGLVGPCSNHVSGEQQVAARYDDDLTGLDGFAWDRGQAHDGVREETDRLVGFCLLIRREVIDAVGLLDERFGLGCFEDDDYSRRALRAGYRAVIARDAFVHHFGSRTFAGAGIDQLGLLRTNRALYLQKWEADGRPSPHPAAPAPVRSAPAAPLPAAPAGGADPRVLVIAHVGFFRDRLDKSHYYRYEALARRPGVTLFGPGLPGYRPGMSAREAVETACGGVWPDVILHGGDVRASNVPLVSGLTDVPALTALELMDSWTFEDRQLEFIRRQRFDLGLMQEGGHHLAFYQEHCPDTRFAWTPHAVNTGLFRDHGLPKEYDVILYGAVNPEVYPLRARLARLLARQRDLRIRHIPHPGYYPAGDAQAAVVAGEELSREINRAWIGIATRSIYHCFLMKYLEIAASRTLVAGDLPDTARPVFAGGCVELHLGQSDEEILAALRGHLADKERLRALTDTVHRRVLAECSTDAFADRLLAHLRERLAEWRSTRRPRSLPPAVPVRGAMPSPGTPPAVRAAPEFGAATAGSAALPENRGALTDPFQVAAAPAGGLLLARPRPQLSLCMIVRDSARTLGACLQSIRPWVDEMIVVDTGSRDHTPELAARLGARVVHFPWPDSFAIARNESLRHARGRWVFWMDSDDTIDAANGRQLRELSARSSDPTVLGYVMQVHCPGAGEAGAADVTVVDHVKLFRNLPELRFEGRLHEQILPAIRRLGGTVAWTDVFVVHSGYDHSPEGQEQKKQRDLRLLHLELQEQPEHPFTLFNLGMTYADLGEYEQAVEFLQRSLALSGEGDSHLRKVYALLVYCSAQLGRADEAGEICAAGLRRFPEDTELHFRRGLLLQQRGRLPEAVAAYQRVLERRGERYFSSLDRGLHGFKTRQNLAVTYAELGDLARAEEQWRRVVAEVPQYRPGWQGLGDVLLAQARYAEIAQLAERLRGDAQLRAAGSILQGRLAIVRGELAQARAVLGGAVRETPEDAELWEHWCRFLFEHGEAEETARALQELLHRVPEDAAALHNLGAIYCRQGRRRQAAEMLRQSLRLRPNAPHTRALLQTVADPAD